jgi:hypothetical protein
LCFQKFQKEYDMNHIIRNHTNPSSHIATTAAIIGGSSFAIGFIGPILLSDNNLGPLLGIFFTGPVGTLAGALIGIIRSVLHAGTRRLLTELRWLVSIWGISLLYTIFVIGGFGKMMIIGALSIQALAVVVGIFLICKDNVARNLPHFALRYGKVYLCAAVLIVLTFIFPPVIPDKDMWEQNKNSILTLEALPKFTFFLDHRLDASKQLPMLDIAKGKLILECLVIFAATGFVCLIIGVRTKKSNSIPIM